MNRDDHDCVCMCLLAFAYHLTINLIAQLDVHICTHKHTEYLNNEIHKQVKICLAIWIIII